VPLDSSPPQASAPLIDDATLRELIDEVGLHLFEAFSARMQASASAHLADLRAGPAQAARAAHALCGLLGHFGLRRAAELARALQGSPAGAPEAAGLVDALEATLAESLRDLPARARRLAPASSASEASSGAQVTVY
jgi:hypothetical protein